MKPSKKHTFDLDKIEFTFDPSNPYELHYHGYGNYEGSRCEGKVKYNEVVKLISDLTSVSRLMK